MSEPVTWSWLHGTTPPADKPTHTWDDWLDQPAIELRRPEPDDEDDV